MKMAATLLIDGDIILYQISSALEKSIHWGDDWWTLSVDFREAKAVIDQEITDLMTQLDADSVVIALSDPSLNFRKDIHPNYKGNRKGTRKPVVYVPLKEYLQDTHITATYSNLEADDVMGILSSTYKDAIIVSDDKDMKTIPGRLYRPCADTLEDISIEEADRYHLTQTLTGDIVDGYKGCPGIGPKTAEKILKEGTWDEVVAAYEKAGLTEEDALVQARLARILRIENWDPKTEEITLWNPK